MGPNGIDGEVGPTGPTGHMGPMGPNGIDGEVGPTGPNGIDGEVGPTGPTGPVGKTIKSVLYNSGRLLEDNFTSIVTISYSGILHTLTDCYIVLNSNGIGGIIKLVDITDGKDITIGEALINMNGISVCNIKNFENLKDEMYVLQLRGKSDNTVQVISVEFNM